MYAYKRMYVYGPAVEAASPMCSCSGYGPLSMSTLLSTTCIELEPVDNTRLCNVFDVGQFHIWRHTLAVPTTWSFSVTPY